MTVGAPQLGTNRRLFARDTVDLAVTCRCPTIPLDLLRVALGAASEVGIVKGMDNVERLQVRAVRCDFRGNETSLIVNEARWTESRSEERNVDVQEICSTCALGRSRLFCDEVDVFADMCLPL